MTPWRFFAPLVFLALGGCFVEVEVDSTDGCVAIDGKTRCEDVVLEFGQGDSYTVAAIPNPGYAFSHWKKGRKYLFGDSTEQVLTLDVSGIDDIPENTYYMEPVFTSLCETDFSGNYSEDYAYLNCTGDRMSTSRSFADILGSKRVYHISVLFYVDTNRPELGRLTPDEFVREQVEAQNKALMDSGVHLQFTVAGVIPITIPFTGESQVNPTLDNMVDRKGAFSRIVQDRERYEADLVHTIVKFANGSNSCGAAYISAIDLPDRYHVGVTSCFAFEDGDLRYSLAHELGHNLGLDHDPANQDEGGHSHYRFGQGWSRWSDFYRIGSIMAYADQRELFSSPHNQIRDKNTGRMYTMGDGTTNAVRALNLVRLDYSQIRPRITGNPSAFGSSASSPGSRPNRARPPKRSERCMLPMRHH